MFRFIVSRLLQAIPVLLVVITATFFLVRAAPGGPFSAEKTVAPEVIKALEAQYKLDQPVWQQYLSYLNDLAHGDFGPSFRYPGRSVDELIAGGLPITAELAFYAMLVAIIIGVSAGVLAALKPNTPAGLCAHVRRHDWHLYAFILNGAIARTHFWYLVGVASCFRLG